MPWPCQSFLGQETPEVCQHYVHAPRNIQIEFEASEEPTYDAITVSWNPSQYGNKDTKHLPVCLSFCHYINQNKSVTETQSQQDIVVLLEMNKQP